MTSAITDQGLVPFSSFEGAVDADRFILSLEDMIQDARRKALLLVENPGEHRANRVRGWAAENSEKIEPFYLSPYAPELNPARYMNRDMKTAVSSGPTIKTTDAPLQNVRTCMERTPEMPDWVLACFSDAYVRPAQ